MNAPLAKPILFSAPMIRALLDGRKTMTRRVIQPQPWNADGDCVDINIASAAHYMRGSDGRMYFQFDHPRGGPLTAYLASHAPGMLLWVREAWRTESRAYDDLAPADMDADYPVLYDIDADWSSNKSTGRARQAAHMPRWASRLTLKVTAVKGERLQDISEEDAVAEGISGTRAVDWMGPKASLREFSPVDGFAALWTSIHGPGSWDANPWVSATTFEPIHRNVDDVIREMKG